MINILTEDFLSIEEVAIYLEKFGYSYDLEKQHEYTRLYSKIYDLNTQNNVTVLFHYYGMLQEEIEEVDYDENLCTGEPVRIPIYKEVNNIHANAHYYVDTALLRNILINEEQVELDHYISKYGKDELSTQNQERSYFLKNSVHISARHLRIPKCELDSVFEEILSSSTIDNQINKPTQKLLDDKILSHAEHSENDEVFHPKDSAYHLIAVLKDLLLDPNTTPYMFRTDNQKSTNQPTQAGLAEHIAAMNLKGLKARNINGIFSDANRLLNDLKKY
ncbi:hypothetical protein GCM10016272_23600 [Psychrobacter glaciei]|uniref:Uncharacterized protein n=2 Tax=Psychrobacter glaciei TaxID=619771 RepID=A0ABQ3GSV6_9GAMM|nr:hypothetical protein GCM10016272_23600 [Psychrobacter glaciei]